MPSGPFRPGWRGLSNFGVSAPACSWRGRRQFGRARIRSANDATDRRILRISGVRHRFQGLARVFQPALNRRTDGGPGGYNPVSCFLEVLAVDPELTHTGCASWLSALAPLAPDCLTVGCRCPRSCSLQSLSWRRTGCCATINGERAAALTVTRGDNLPNRKPRAWWGAHIAACICRAARALFPDPATSARRSTSGNSVRNPERIR